MLVGIFNQSTFLSLRDMAAVLDCGRFDDRKLAADASGLPLKKSNEIFDEVRAQAWPTVARMANMHDPRYPIWCADRELMFSGMFNMLAPPAVARWSGEKTPRAIETVVGCVCRRLADTWDPKRVSPLLFPLLNAVPHGERTGAIVKGEHGLPMREHSFRKWFRKIARAAGIPDEIWNMDSRAGAATEAEEALANLGGIWSPASAATNSPYCRTTSQIPATSKRWR
jgi:hypothetical protein